MVTRVAQLLIAAALLVAAGCREAGGGRRLPEVLTVFAAASTADAMSEIAERFEASTGTRVRCSFAASSTLARQIEHGADADLFLSADVAWMDHLEQLGRLVPATRRDLIGNTLVVIVPAGAGATDLETALGSARWIALGDPDHVPAGRYAKQALLALGMWDGVAPRLVSAVDVRAALHLVALGSADAGIVYATDAAASSAVRVAATLPDGAHEPVLYPVALVEGRRGSSAEAVSFLAFLETPVAVDQFRSHGFAIPGS